MAKPVCVNDFEELARKTLPKYAYDFYASGANEEFTLRENSEAYKRFRIKPRILQGISNVDMSLSLFGERISMPICMAPVGLQAMANTLAEMASAQAGQEAKICMVLSCMASATIEDVAKTAPNGLRWLQMYMFRDQELTRSLVRRAEDSGYKAIVLTVDAITHGWRWRDLKNQSVLLPHMRFGNIRGSKTEACSTEDYALYVKSLLEQAIDWTSFSWLKSITRLPVLIKGILTAEDAKFAVQHGVNGIIVSNHGGRQLDGVPATIDALPEIIKAVEGKVDVFIDGGIRNGTDVLKALALGARAVFIGRPVLWGLAYQGKQGVSDVLAMLKEEFKTAMLLADGRVRVDYHFLSGSVPSSYKSRELNHEVLTAELFVKEVGSDCIEKITPRGTSNVLFFSIFRMWELVRHQSVLGCKRCILSLASVIQR